MRGEWSGGVNDKSLELSFRSISFRVRPESGPRLRHIRHHSFVERIELDLTFSSTGHHVFPKCFALFAVAVGIAKWTASFYSRPCSFIDAIDDFEV